MSEESGRKQLRERLVIRLGGFIQGIGLSVEEVRRIIERAIDDAPSAAPADLEAKARLDANRAGLSDVTDFVLDAVAALRADGITVAPIGDELEQWQISYFAFTDAELLRLAESRGLVEVSV